MSDVLALPAIDIEYDTTGAPHACMRTGTHFLHRDQIAAVTKHHPGTAANYVELVTITGTSFYTQVPLPVLFGWLGGAFAACWQEYVGPGAPSA